MALLTSPVLAADTKASSVSVPALNAEEKAERLKLAADFADIKPIREAVDRDIENATMGMGDDEKEQFMRFVQLRINYDKIEHDSINLMAEMFTVAELKAMIAYYGSKEGQSAENKARDYTAKIGPLVSSAIDGAMMDAKLGPAR